MSISVNGQSQVPPGFRFHPTEEELLQYYLRKKLASEEIDLDVIRDVDLNKLEPWDIQEMCKIGSSTTPQNDWYFFSHKDKKYPTGTRTNRATVVGFWKATGRDKVIYSDQCRSIIGMRKTLVFYKGRAPHGQKSDWIMHEYRVDDHNKDTISPMQEEPAGWVVCRVFKKKNHYNKTTYNNAAGTSPYKSTTTTSPTISDKISSSYSSYDDHDQGTLEQVLLQSFRSQNWQLPLDDDDINNRRFLKLPSLQEEIISNNYSSQPVMLVTGDQELIANPAGPPLNNDQLETSSSSGTLQDWAALDRLIASHLNGTAKTNMSSQLV